MDSGSSGADRLIRRKIVPPDLPPTVVARERVELLLARLIEQHRFVIMCASAGAGKTTAAVQAAHRLRRPLVWLDVDVTDTATGRLLVYLEAALRGEISDLGAITASAFAAKLAHPEIAGLLADALGDRSPLVVIDNVERLQTSRDALAVIGAFARYLPQSARLLLLSRTELAFDSSLGRAPWVPAIGEQDLALTVDEAAAALSQVGRDELDATEAVRQTGGWMTGVLFEAWRSADHVLGIGGDSDPLHGYLATEILNQLGDADREFLVTTAVLTEITEQAAAALGVSCPSARLRSLAGRRIPASWSNDGTLARCHPRFREFLLKEFHLRDTSEQHLIRRRHAGLLTAQGHPEDAIEEYLRSDGAGEALQIMPPVLEAVVERMDFAVADRWLKAVSSVRDPRDLDLPVAEMLMAVARENFAAGADLADTVAGLDLRDDLACRSGRAASLMAWCYLHVGDPVAIDDVLAVAPDGPEVQAARYTMNLVRDDPDSMVGVGSIGGPLEALLMRGHFDLGRLSQLTTAPSSPWAAQLAESWLAGALLATGDVDGALELYHRLRGSRGQSVWLTALLGPKLMMELNEIDVAWRLLREGTSRIEATGSQLFLKYGMLLEAELDLRIARDTKSARDLLERIDVHPVGQYAFVREQRLMLQGLADLLDDDPVAALDVLRSATDGMTAGHRLLFLPQAAVYLAEAYWRAGDEEAADTAANLALDAAGRQGSNHLLLHALAQFPDVLSRRIDLEPTADSRWHDLGRSLLVRGVQLTDVVQASVHLVEFGQVTILVNGVEVAPRLSKSIELLAFLATRDGHEAPKALVLEELFDGRNDESSSSYLRQAIFRLRKAIPDIFAPDASPGLLRLGTTTKVTTESQRLRGLLSQSAGMVGERKLTALLDAVEIADRGEYLPGARSEWVDGQRRQLQPLVEDARCEAAEVALSLGHYRQADRLAEMVLRADRYQERAWRLRMRIAHAHGDEQRVIRTFRSCRSAMEELGTDPSTATVALMQDLRR